MIVLDHGKSFCSARAFLGGGLVFTVLSLNDYLQ